MDKNLLFICLGNICRSPAAQGIMQHIIDKNNMTLLFKIDSAGTYGGHAGELPDSRMRAHARRRGYELTHRSRPVTSDDFDNFDLIFAMDDSNFHNLQRLAPSPEAQQKIKKITDFCTTTQYDHVPDPYYSGAEGFELVLNILEDACQGIFNHLKSK